MSNLTLYELTARQQRIEDMLVENGGELTPELEAELNDNTEALTEKVDGYHHIIRRMEAQAAAFKKAKEEMAEKQRICNNAVKRIKEHLAHVMQAGGITKLEGELAKVTLRRNEVVNVYDEDELMKPYHMVIETLKANLPPFITVDVKVNNTALKEDITAGKPVAGAELTDSYTVTIR